MGDEDLEELARVGRERAAQKAGADAHAAIAAERERRVEQEREDTERRQKEERIALRKVSRWGEIAIVPIGAWLGNTLILSVVFGLFVLLAELLPDVLVRPLQLVVGALIACFVVTSIALRFLAGPRARAALDREIAWAQALPFTVPEYEGLLFRENAGWTPVLTLHFKAETIDPDFLHDVLSVDGATWTVERLGSDALRAKRDVAPPQVVTWIHEVVATRLLPIHERHQLHAVLLGLRDGLYDC